MTTAIEIHTHLLELQAERALARPRPIPWWRRNLPRGET